MKNIFFSILMILNLQYAFSQTDDSNEMKVGDAIVLQTEVLDSIYLTKSLTNNAIAQSIKKESIVIKDYISDLISFTENNFNADTSHTIDFAWSIEFNRSNLEQELSNYEKSIRSILSDTILIDKFCIQIDRKSKFKYATQEGKKIINTFPKESIIVFYKVQYIDIVNAEIFRIIS